MQLTSTLQQRNLTVYLPFLYRQSGYEHSKDSRVDCRRRNIRPQIPLIIPEAAQVELMCITIRSDLRMSSHMENVLASCTSSMNALDLRSHSRVRVHYFTGSDINYHH